MAMISLVIILLAWFYPIIRETGTIKKTIMETTFHPANSKCSERKEDLKFLYKLISHAIRKK